MSNETGDLFAVACSLSKTEGGARTTIMVLCTRVAQSEDEAKGAAVTVALDGRPGFGVEDMLCLKVGSGFMTEGSAEK